ncbi:hypothetical protein M426DRAFT_268576 [Hypoxylon sp. CI-4A]|nr:hypothetical protein M426DRAFT_268576 [Hypoxylon sp. CI-4A]
MDRNQSSKPILSLEMSASERLSTTLPYHVKLSITRDQGNPDDKPVIFRWSPTTNGFGAAGFELIHKTTHDNERIEIDHSSIAKLPDDKALLVNGFNQSLWELAPGGKVTFVTTLPERFQKPLVAGKKYQLVWPGGRASIWEWGAIKDHMNKKLLPKEKEEDCLVLPGGPHVSFTAETESNPWPRREEREAVVGFQRANMEEERWRQSQVRAPSPPPIQASERDPEAPVLNVELKCPSIIKKGETLEVKVKVTYEGNSSKPIIFHTHAIEVRSGPREGYRLYRRRHDEWEECDLDEDEGFRIVDDPDVPVKVSEHEDFVSLRPGESWTTSRHLQGGSWTELPADAAPGDVFRYVFKGATALDWWDWGSGEDHKETVVKLPCWIKGPVVDPAHNGGRPKLVIPASNCVEFALAD